MKKKYKYDVFISFSYKDEKLVRAIEFALRASRVTVYCDMVAGHGMVHGSRSVDDISKLLMDRMLESRAMLVIDTENARASKWVHFETRFFKALNRPIDYMRYF